jgi:arabinofuranan 3-O-arabinosyltransferase
VLGPSGVLRFAPIRARALAFRFTPAQAPLQISGVTIPGVPALGTPSGPFRLPCGLGPRVELNGRVLPTRVTGTFVELLTGQPMPFTACPGARIAAGANRVVEPPSDPFDVQDVVLVRPAGPPGGGAAAGAAPGGATSGGGVLGPEPRPAAAAVIRSWTPARRVLQVAAPARSYLVVNENFNAGWQARLGGRTLSAVRLDGWKQAWLLPAGTAGTVTLAYRPDALYRDALGGGLGGLAQIVLVALWPGTPAWRPRWLRLPGLRRRARARRTATETPAAENVGPAGPARSPRRWRPRPGLSTALATVAVVCCLLLAGLWLSGYPGAVILTAAAALFAVAVSQQRAHWAWHQLSRPWAVAALLLAAAACGAAGEQLLLPGTTTPLATALVNTAPQVICLIVVGRLAAALVVGDP